MPRGAPLSSRERSARYRAARKAQGLRCKEIWVWDLRNPVIREQIRRECEIIAAADRARRAERTPE